MDSLYIPTASFALMLLFIEYQKVRGGEIKHQYLIPLYTLAFVLSIIPAMVSHLDFPKEIKPIFGKDLNTLIGASIGTSVAGLILSLADNKKLKWSLFATLLIFFAGLGSIPLYFVKLKNRLETMEQIDKQKEKNQNIDSIDHFD